MKISIVPLAGLATLCLLGCAWAARDPPHTELKKQDDSSNIADRISEQPVSLMSASDLYSDGYTPRHIAGYFKLNRTYAAEMFYFFFEQRTATDGPLVLWMTGGPGCSSELAVFYENGPYRLHRNATTKKIDVLMNEYGWDMTSSLIFVDQPINTGFSYSEDPRDRVYDEDTVAADMLDFLLAFFEVHPEMNKDVWIVGESYAGHYVPAVSYNIHLFNKQASKEDQISLRGLAIGNGLTDPAIQYGAYSDFALKNGVIGQILHDTMKKVFPICKFGIDVCNSSNLSFVCLLSLLFCQNTQFVPILVAAGNINVYDIRKECEGALCYDFSLLDEYINQKDVREKLGVGDRRWEACSESVHTDMMGDWMKNYDPIVVPMLEDGLKAMIYAGQEDLICNWLGNQRWVDALPWSGHDEFATAPEEKWTVNGTAAGSVRTAKGLSFVKVALAGHMVPMDQPVHSLDMITRFTRGKKFDTDTVRPIISRPAVSAVDRS